MPPSTDTPAEVRCFFSLGPIPEGDRNDSDALVKATCLHFCDEVMEGAVEDEQKLVEEVMTEEVALHQKRGVLEIMLLCEPRTRIIK